MPTVESHSEILLRTIVGAICKRSKDHTIRYSEAGSTWVIMNLDERDQGRLIGKGGATFYALETCMWYAGLAHAKRPEPVKLISQPRSDRTPPKSPFKPNPKWNRKAIGKLVDTITTACLKKTVPWVMEEQGESDAVISIQLEKYLQTPISDPDFKLALETLVHSAAMSDGANVTANISWK
jgi:hypothetical protein